MSQNMRGALFMMIALGAYTCNDAVIKLVALDLGLFQSVALRGIIATVLLAGLCWARGAFRSSIPRADRGRVSLRVGAEVIGTVTFLTALLAAPLADVTAVLQIVPLAVTLAAALFFGEALGWRRMLAIGGGFFGVMLIIRPTGDVNPALFLALITVGLIVVRDLSTRRLSANVSGLLVALCTATAIMVLGMVGSLFTGWQPVSLGQLGGLGLAAVFILLGYIFSIEAMRAGEVSFVAPFRYSVMVWAFALGFLVFGETPDALTLVGCAIVVVMGLYAWHRERVLSRSPGPS